MTSLGHVTQLSVRGETEYHVAVTMPNGERQEWLLTAKEIVKANFHAAANASLLPLSKQPLKHSPLWCRLLRKMRALI